MEITTENLEITLKRIDDPARTEDMAHLLTAALAFSNRNQFFPNYLIEK